MPAFKIKKIISRFKSLPLSRKIQFIENTYFRLKAVTVYKFWFKKIGKGCVVRKPLFLSPEHITLGDGVIIWDDARIEGVLQQNDQMFSPTIEIETGVSIQQRCHITAASHLSIGANSLISFDVMIQDTDHQFQELEIPIGSQPLLVKTTRIGENCFIGSGAKIQAGTILGKHCVVGTNAVVRGEFPDYCVLVGMPAKIIKRYNETTLSWDKTDKFGNFL
jgi:acetyltransferase-like isoleucine patch superfamily enzyme